MANLQPNIDTIKSGNLVGADLSGMDLRSYKFRKANLKGANLSHCNIVEVDFWGANLQGATLELSLIHI